jgi:hypothetical protein
MPIRVSSADAHQRHHRIGGIQQVRVLIQAPMMSDLENVHMQRGRTHIAK